MHFLALRFVGFPNFFKLGIKYLSDSIMTEDVVVGVYIRVRAQDKVKSVFVSLNPKCCRFGLFVAPHLNGNYRF